MLTKNIRARFGSYDPKKVHLNEIEANKFEEGVKLFLSIVDFWDKTTNENWKFKDTLESTQLVLCDKNECQYTSIKTSLEGPNVSTDLLGFYSRNQPCQIPSYPSQDSTKVGLCLNSIMAHSGEKKGISFETLIVKVLVHEFAHAVMDNKCQSQHIKRNDPYKLVEESLANCLTLNVISHYVSSYERSKTLLEEVKGFIKDQPLEYQLGYYLYENGMKYWNDWAWYKLYGLNEKFSNLVSRGYLQPHAVFPKHSLLSDLFTIINIQSSQALQLSHLFSDNEKVEAIRSIFNKLSLDIEAAKEVLIDRGFGNILNKLEGCDKGLDPYTISEIVVIASIIGRVTDNKYSSNNIDPIKTHIILGDLDLCSITSQELWLRKWELLGLTETEAINIETCQYGEDWERYLMGIIDAHLLKSRLDKVRFDLKDLELK